MSKEKKKNIFSDKKERPMKLYRAYYRIHGEAKTRITGDVILVFVVAGKILTHHETLVKLYHVAPLLLRKFKETHRSFRHPLPKKLF
jgi:hypothetical protein